jgi:hypothetical protein
VITMDTYGHLFPASNDRPSSKRAGTVQEHKQTFPTPLHHGSPSSDFPDTNSN